MLQKDLVIEERKHLVVPQPTEKIVYVRPPHKNIIDRGNQYEEPSEHKKDA